MTTSTIKEKNKSPSSPPYSSRNRFFPDRLPQVAWEYDPSLFSIPERTLAMILPIFENFDHEVEVYKENLEKSLQKLQSDWIPPHYSPSKRLHSQHLDLLAYLINEQRMPLKDALCEMNELDEKLANTLKCFYQQGLRGSNLRELKNYILEHQPDFSFSDSFADIHHTLDNYINNKQLSITDALEEIKYIYFSPTLGLD